MIHPLTVDGSVELAVVERNGFDESRHLGAAVVTDPDGAVGIRLGDVDAAIYPRSSLKPLQALSVRRDGLRLAGPEAVLSAASHAGTRRHTEVARGILSSAGLDEEALGCPADFPLDPAAARAAEAPLRIAHNCSGKHAAFLATTVLRSEDPGAYLDPDAPLQRRIRSTIEELAGERIEQTGTDGCGAPLHALSLAGLARAIGRFVRDRDGADVTEAILRDPWALDGEGRANTVVIEECRILAKGGAEGVLVAAAEDGTAVALKMLDGGARAATLVALQLLERVGAVEHGSAVRASERATDRVLGGEAVVGRIRAGEAIAAL